MLVAAFDRVCQRVGPERSCFVDHLRFASILCNIHRHTNDHTGIRLPSDAKRRRRGKQWSRGSCTTHVEEAPDNRTKQTSIAQPLQTSSPAVSLRISQPSKTPSPTPTHRARRHILHHGGIRTCPDLRHDVRDHQQVRGQRGPEAAPRQSAKTRE